ncbi:Bug family tripartite tricarboxylate transporter substrate binding protein, partial [Chloroflexota bacterium]
LWRAEPDGYTLGMMDIEKFVSYQMVADVEFDIKEYEWLSIPATGYYALGVAADSDFYSVQDVIDAGKVKPIRHICGGVGTTEIVFTEVTGVNSEYNSGFGGGAETKLAVIRGDGDIQTITDASFSPYIESGDMRMLMFFSDEKSEIFESIGHDVPTAVELGYPELATLFGPRGFAAPPGTPSGVVDALTDAFTKAYADPELIAWGEEAGRPIRPKTRAETIEAMESLYDLYGKYGDIFAEYIDL